MPRRKAMPDNDCSRPDICPPRSESGGMQAREVAVVIRLLVQRLIQWIRKNPSYVLDSEIHTQDVSIEVGYRLSALIRAQWKLMGVRGGRVRFVESGCQVRHRRFLSLGTGSVLEHGARLSCLGLDGTRIGRRVTIGKYAIIECTSVLWHLGAGLEIGDNSSVGDYSFIGCAGGVKIGNNVLMGQRVSFHSQNHRFGDPSSKIADQGVQDGPIIVGNDCWLGSGSILLAGVELGDGCVVAAGSVINTSFGPNSVVAGVPARLVKVRGANQAADAEASRSTQNDQRQTTSLDHERQPQSPRGAS
jgi:acetyltransferase-like isoleucine patch superfamily enzyme